MTNKPIDILIIGSGPAGLTAAIYGARGNVSVMVVEGDEPGGQLMYTQSIENYPGFVASGMGLVEAMRKQAKGVGVQFSQDFIAGIEPTEGQFIVSGRKQTFIAKTVIIATGSNARWLNLPDEEKFRGQGISTCATCDGFAVKGKVAGVVGGGNTAVEDAIYLSKLCEKVILIHRRDTLRAEQIMQKKLFSCENISYQWNRQVKGYLGDGDFEGVLLDDGQELKLDGLFVAIGHVPNTQFLQGLLPLTSDGYIDTNTVTTSVPGLFAAGDVMDPIDRQAITAAGYGCMAARRALHYLSMNGL